MNDDDDTLDRHEVCKALGGINLKTLQKLIKDRKFPNAAEISEGIWKWYRRDVRAYLYLKGRIGGTPPIRGKKVAAAEAEEA